MRERTPLRRDVIERLPRLRFIASTGSRNISIDIAAANERGILVAHTGYRSTPTVELTWALILASVRHLVGENDSIRNGGWQTSIGHLDHPPHPERAHPRSRRRLRAGAHEAHGAVGQHVARPDRR